MNNILMFDVFCRDDIIGPMRPLAVFADQLTVERTRGIHNTFFDGDAPEECLEGLFGAISDFHEKMNFLQVRLSLEHTGITCRYNVLRNLCTGCLKL